MMQEAFSALVDVRCKQVSYQQEPEFMSNQILAAIRTEAKESQYGQIVFCRYMNEFRFHFLLLILCKLDHRHRDSQLELKKAAIRDARC